MFPPPSPLLCEISFAQQADLILRTFTEVYCREDFSHDGRIRKWKAGGGYFCKLALTPVFGNLLRSSFNKL